LNPPSSTNDVIAVIDGASMTYGGTLTLTNISLSPLQAGNSFLLFSAASYAGAFAAFVPATPGAGLVWNTNNLAVNGVLSVSGAALPRFTTVIPSGTNLVFNGTNGTPNAAFYVLQSTNITLPRINWTIAATNHFDGSGNFNFTNAADSAIPRRFYLLEVPPQ